MISLKNFLDGRSLFSEIIAIEPLPFIDYSATDLDTMLVTLYGSKTVHVPIESCDLTIIAKMISIKHGAEWERLLKIKALEENLNTVREITETSNSVESRLIDKNDTNKVSGYNSEIMVDNDSTVGNISDDLTGELVKTTTDSYTDGERIYSLLSTRAKQGMINTVLENVNSFLTLSIY